MSQAWMKDLGYSTVGATMKNIPARRFIPWLAWLVLAASLGATFWAYEAAEEQVAQKDRVRFDDRVEQVRFGIKERLRNVEQVFQGARGLYAASRSVERDEWRAYLESIDVTRNYPGARGVAFVERVARDHLAAFLAETRADGAPDFKIWPRDNRADYYIVKYIEPMATVSGLLGFDIGSDTRARKPTAEQARDFGRIALTGKISLAHDKSGPTGFAFMLPIYRNGFTVSTVEERRVAFQGLVYCSFDVRDLMQGIAGMENQDIDFEIFDGIEIDAEHLLYSTRGGFTAPNAESRPTYVSATPIEVGGRVWLLNAMSLPSFNAGADRGRPIIVLAVGLIGSFLIFALIWSLTSTRRLALAQAETMTAKFRSVLETASEAFIAIDHRGLIIDWNRQSEVTFGWPRAEATGRILADLIVPPKYREAHLRALAGFLKTGEGAILNRRIELSALRRDGTEFPIEITVWPNRAGDTWTFNAFVHDITERKRAQNDLLAARYSAESLSRAKSEFLAHMSHELRAPLNSIIGFAQILQSGRGKKFGDTEMAYLDRVLENAAHLLTLINEVLDLSKVEARQMTLEVEMIDLEVFIRQTVDQMGGRVLGRSVRLECDIPRPLAPLETDPVKLKQVLFNLIVNAIKFTDSGTITVRVTADDETLSAERIDVVDTGVGIPAEKLQMIFEPFQQAGDATRRKTSGAGGAGLGLTISKSLCGLMGYQIEVKSELGKGSTFSIVIPKDSAMTGQSGGSVRAVDRRSVSPVAPRDGSRAKFAGMTVLIVDDEPDSRILLTRHFEDLGFHVQSAGSGSRGLQMAREIRPDIITIDLLMRDKNGWEAIRDFKRDPDLQTTPLLVVSNIADDNRASLSSADEILNKPVGAADLMASLQRIFTGNRD